MAGETVTHLTIKTAPGIQHYGYLISCATVNARMIGLQNNTEEIVRQNEQGHRNLHIRNNR